MRRVEAYRANKVLYDFLKSNELHGEVLLPANICQSVVDTINQAGLTVCPVDIDSKTLCLDFNEAVVRLEGARVLIYVHTYGAEFTPDSQFRRMKHLNPDLVIIDDRCLCMPCTSSSRAILSENADLTLYSTGKKKQVDLQRGGWGFMQDKWLYENHPDSNVFFDDEPYFLDEEYIEVYQHMWGPHKEALRAIYRENLPREICLPDDYQKWRFNVLVPDAQVALEAIFACGLFASSHYKPISDCCPNAASLQSRIINLFCDHYYSDTQALKTCKVINQLLQEGEEKNPNIRCG